MSETSMMTRFKAGDGVGQGYLAVPPVAKGGVLVLHAWWGLNDFFRRSCDRLASEGYVALAPDLCDGKVVTTIDEAKEMVEKRDGKADYDRVLGAVEYLKSHPSVGGRKVGLVGFSFGAAYALWLSAARPHDVAAVVVFYGTYPGVDFSKAEASFLGHFAPNDEWEPLSGVQEVEEKLRSLGKDVKFYFYPETKHWFFEENRPGYYDEKAARLAWTRTLEFLNAKL